MGCISSSSKIDTVIQFDDNVLEYFHGFRFDKVAELYITNKAIKNKIYNVLFSYNFSIYDYFDLTSFIFNFDAYLKQNRQSSNILYTILTNHGRYNVNINFNLANATMTNLCLSMITMFDIVPEKYLSQIPTYEKDKTKKNLKMLIDFLNDNTFYLKACENIQFIHYTGDAIISLNNELKEKYIKRTARECVVCMENPKNTIFFPCKHMVCCNKCCDTILFCPICMCQIDEKIIPYDC